MRENGENGGAAWRRERIRGSGEAGWQAAAEGGSWRYVLWRNKVITAAGGVAALKWNRAVCREMAAVSSGLKTGANNH